jgi:hypothetical protein
LRNCVKLRGDALEITRRNIFVLRKGLAYLLLGQRREIQNRAKQQTINKFKGLRKVTRKAKILKEIGI